MNPNPADNSQNVSQNQNPQPEVPQLENETPMDITIYPSNENPENSVEPQKISSPESMNTEVIPVNTINPIPNPESIMTPMTTIAPEAPLNTEPVQTPETTNLDIPKIEEVKPASPTSELSFNQNPLEKKESNLFNLSPQKIAIIGGSIVGITIVIIASFLFLYKKPETKIETKVTPVEQAKNLQPAPSTITQEIQNLSSSEYKLKVNSLYTKYQNIKNNNPLNLTTTILSTETVKFVSDEIFAISNELNELNLEKELMPYNEKLTLEFQTLVSYYDELLRSYKSSNQLTNEMRMKFTSGLKTSEEALKNTVNEINSLQ